MRFSAVNMVCLFPSGFENKRTFPGHCVIVTSCHKSYTHIHIRTLQRGSCLGFGKYVRKTEYSDR